jgi:hypothetical protein
MKSRLISVTAALLVAYGAIAQPPQLEKGNIMLGVTSSASMEGSWGSDLMSLGIMHTKYTSGSDSYNEHKARSFSLIPKGGYFIIDNLSAGLEALYTRSSFQHVDSEGKWTATSFAIGPWVRYYYPLEKVYPFAELEVMAGTCVEKVPTSGPEPDVYRYSLFSTGLSLGVAVPLGDMVTFDIMAGYMRSVWRDKNDMEGEESDFSEIYSGAVIRMGFIVFL